MPPEQPTGVVKTLRPLPALEFRIYHVTWSRVKTYLQHHLFVRVGSTTPCLRSYIQHMETWPASVT